jgi:ketosteroid isomerase-like protein
MSTAADLDRVIEQYHRALGQFMKGDYEPARRLFSEREDITLGNPFGPFARGAAKVVEAMQKAASHYRDGLAAGFETISKFITPDFAYIVEIERLESKVGGRDNASPVHLRATSIFRREEDGWKLIHRHADPITTERPADSVLKS